MMRKLLEAMTKFAGEPEQKPGEQWKGTDKGTPGKQLVGDSIIKDLSKGVTPKTKEEELAEAFANFNEDDLGVEEKRPGRKSDRPSREYTKDGKPSKRYTTVEEGWMDGSDRVNLPDGAMTYWNGTGRLQNEYNELYEKLVPSQGAAETIEGEVLRASSKIVYRHFNDGDLFNQASFDQLKQYIGTVTDYDDLAEKAIEFALKAQGNYHPNTGWDSLDAMDYGPTDDNDGWDEDDEYDDEDDTNWDEEDDELEESSDVVARYADNRARGTGFVYNVDATGQITSSGNIRHNKKFSSPEKAMAYLDKCGFTKKGELEEGMEEFAKSQAKKRAEKRKSIPWPKEVPSDADQERNRTRDEEENDPHPYADTPDLDEAKWRENPDAYSSELDDEGNEYKKSKGDVGRDLLKKDKLGYTRPGNANVVSKGARTGKATQSHINQLKGNIKHSLANHGKANLPEGEHDAEFIDHEDNWYNMADWARAEFKKGKSVEEVIKYLRDNDYLGPRDINNFMKTVSGEKWNESVEEGVNEGAADVYSITSERNGRERSKSGTLAELIEYYGYTLETGKSYEHERGNRKINLNPKSIESLVQNLNNAKSNAAANGQSNERFYVDHGNMAEGKHFRTAYGWAGGRNEKTGKMYKHPDQIKADREANKMAIAQAQIDADRENERDRFSQEELYPSDDSHDVDEGWEADLARSNRERMKKERAAAKPMKPIAKAKPDYSRVFHDINMAIGDTFPDGDPMDALMRKYRDSYGDLNIDLLNKACRVNGAKSYHDYVAKVWQQHMQDNPDLVQGGNPWIAENGHPQHSVDRYNKDLERKIDKDFDPDYDRTMSDQEFEAKLKQRGKERDKGVAEGLGKTIKKAVKNVKRGLDGWDNEYTQDSPKNLVKKNKAYSDKEINVLRGDPTISTEFPHSPAGLQRKVLDREAKKRGMKEGWESGPDDITKQERDPDADYRARRQEKLDAEADSAPKTTTYQCVGRGPNDEPNYKFGPEHNTSEEAVAYRKKLMANPKTPNPRDIGIRTISKVAKGINEDITSTDPLEGAVLSAVQELIQQGHTEVAPEVITNMVVAATSQPFLLKDLVDANNNSPAIQHYVDSINPTKVKFSSDILTVKNEDPAKDKAKAQAGVSSMASRAANRSRLGESAEISKQGFPDAFIGLVYRDAEIKHDTQPVPMTKKPTKNDLASNVIVVKGKDGNFYGARSNRREGYTIYGQVDGKVGKQYVSSIREVASWIKSGEYFAIPLNSTYYKSREAQRYTRGQDRQSSEYSAILTQMNNTFTPAIKQRIEEYIDYIYANLRKLSNKKTYTYGGTEQEDALEIAASLEQLVKAGFTRNTVDEYLRSLGKRDVGFGSHYTNMDRFLEQMKEPLAQAKFAKTILDQAKGLYNRVKDMLYAPTVNALTAEGVNEGIETPLRDKEDYDAKRKALQQIQVDPSTKKDPELKAELARRLASLNQQYSTLHEQISKFKESRGTKAITTKLDNMDNMRNVQIPTPAERREQIRIRKEKEAGKQQVKEFAAPGMNPATPVATNTAAKPDPATVAKAAAATNTLKAATGTVVAPATLDKALDSATQGTATSTDVKALAPIMGVVNKAASDPKLAAQFKNLANQAKTTP